MKRYKFVLTGISPLLMHADSVEHADALTEWRKAPENKALSKSGDDRSPVWTWKTYLYGDGKHIGMPSDNLMTCLREAGTAMKIKGNQSYKALTQSGLMIEEFMMPFFANGVQVKMSDVERINNKGEFHEHEDGARNLGFELFVKRAKIGAAKHIRVRPKFDNWSVEGTLIVTEEEALKKVILQQIFDIGGALKGLCDWRPSSGKSGQFGRFKAKLTEVK